VTAVINAQGQPIGNTFRDITPAEILAGVTLANGDLDELDPLRYSDTLDQAAVQAAVNVAFQRGGGRVPIREDFLFTSAVAMALNVIIEWWGGTIACDGCSAFTFGFYTATGKHGVIGYLPINGTNCETFPAFDQPGSGSDEDQCYGIVLNGPQVRGFNKVVRFRTAWFFEIQNVRGENINTGLDLAGFNILGKLSDNNFVKAAGCGTGQSDGYLFDSATFTNGGSHQSNPEGIYGVGNEAYGFDTALNLNNVTGLVLLGTDLLGTVNAIKFSTLAGIVEVSGYFAVNGATATAIIKGAGQSVVADVANTKFTGSCIAANTTSCMGFQLDDYGVNQNQANVDVDLEFSGCTSYDIGLFNCGNVNIKRGTKCRSSGVATSIRITGTLSGRPITIEDGVFCVGRVDVPFADTQRAPVHVGALSGTYSTRVSGVSTISNPATSVTTTYESLLGSGAATGNTNGSNGVISALASTNAYAPGATVFVSNGFATTGPFTVLSKTGTTITVNATSDTAEVGITVSLSNIPRFAATADTDMVLDLFLGTPSADVDGVFGSAAVDGVTINVNTTPATSVTIPWEVRVRQRYS
jgi:hypothetical protein